MKYTTVAQPDSSLTPRAAARKTAAQRCAHCQRELLSGHGTDVPFIGVVGPECVKKFSSLVIALEAVNGLECVEWDQGTIVLAHHVVLDLRRIGLAVRVVDVRPGVKAVQIVGLSRPAKKVVESWTEMRARFEQRLKLAQAEREEMGEPALTFSNPVTGAVQVPVRVGGAA